MTRHIRPIRVDGNDAFITLSNGREVVFSAAKVHIVEGYNWHANSNGYAHRKVRENGKRRNIYLHRVLAGATEGVFVDHIDGDIENANDDNLRQCTKQQNGANRRINKNNRSGLKGVTAHGRGWMARIRVHGQQIYLGTRATPEEAYTLYVAAAQKHFGAFARFE